MKNIKTLIFAIILMLSGKIVTSQSLLKDLDNAKISELHNKVVSEIIDKKLLDYHSKMDFRTFFNKNIKTVEETLLNHYGSNSISNSDFILIEHEFETIDNSVLLNSFSDYTMFFIKEMVVKGNIGKDFGNQLLEVCSKSNSLNRTQMLNYLNNYFSNNAVGSESEKRYKELFIAISKKSNELADNNTYKLKPGSSTIIADAVGGLWGLSLGPVGSIVYGAMFSLYENEVMHN